MRNETTDYIRTDIGWEREKDRDIKRLIGKKSNQNALNEQTMKSMFHPTSKTIETMKSNWDRNKTNFTPFKLKETMKRTYHLFSNIKSFILHHLMRCANLQRIPTNNNNDDDNDDDDVRKKEQQEAGKTKRSKCECWQRIDEEDMCKSDFGWFVRWLENWTVFSRQVSSSNDWTRTF